MVRQFLIRLFIFVDLNNNRNSEHKPHPTNFGSRNGTVVRALASHQGGLGLITRLCVISGLSLLLVFILAPGGFSRIISKFSCCLSFVHSQSFQGQTKLALSNMDTKKYDLYLEAAWD